MSLWLFRSSCLRINLVWFKTGRTPCHLHCFVQRPGMSVVSEYYLTWCESNSPCSVHHRHCQLRQLLSCNMCCSLRSCNGYARPLIDSDQCGEAILQWVLIMRWTILNCLTWSATSLKFVRNWYVSFSGPCIFSFGFVLKFRVTPLASISSNTCILKWFSILFRSLLRLLGVCLPSTDVSMKMRIYIKFTWINVFNVESASCPEVSVCIVCTSNAVYKSNSMYACRQHKRI